MAGGEIARVINMVEAIGFASREGDTVTLESAKAVILRPSVHIDKSDDNYYDSRAACINRSAAATLTRRCITLRSCLPPRTSSPSSAGFTASATRISRSPIRRWDRRCARPARRRSNSECRKRAYAGQHCRGHGAFAESNSTCQAIDTAMRHRGRKKRPATAASEKHRILRSAPGALQISP